MPVQQLVAQGCERKRCILVMTGGQPSSLETWYSCEKHTQVSRVIISLSLLRHFGRFLLGHTNVGDQFHLKFINLHVLSTTYHHIYPYFYTRLQTCLLLEETISICNTLIMFLIWKIFSSHLDLAYRQTPTPKREMCLAQITGNKYDHNIPSVNAQ